MRQTIRNIFRQQPIYIRTNMLDFDRHHLKCIFVEYRISPTSLYLYKHTQTDMYQLFSLI